MTPRSKSKCLLCLDEVKKKEESFIKKEEELLSVFPGFDIPGAVNCDLLRRQLENVFILRKILEVPQLWCEEALGGISLEGKGEENGGAGPASWFNVCEHCLEGSVAQAWRIHQQILALEVKLLEIKEEVKGRMKEEILKPRNRSLMLEGELGGNKGLEGKIRRLIFPDLLLTKLEPECDLLEGDELDMTYFEIEMDANSNCSDDWTTDKDVKDVHKFKKKSSKSNSSKRPIKKKRPPQAPKEDDDKSKEKSWYCCRLKPKCGARYRHPQELEAHLLLHDERQQNGVTDLDCPHCPFPAKDTFELEQHLRIRHKLKPRLYHFTCPKCDFTIQKDYALFKDHFDKSHPPKPEDLDDHQSSSLPSDLPIICPLCTKRCGNLKTFISHQVNAHPEQVGIQVESLALECDLCKMKFLTQFKLQCHLKLKHPQTAIQLSFICDECGRSFRIKSQLNRHKKGSHLQKQYVCHLCGLDYAYKWILDKHYRTYHPSTTVPPPPNQGPSKGNHLQCKYCNFTAPFKGILNRHLEQHKKENGHRCDQCGKLYMNETGLKRHLKINHPLVKEEVPCPYCLKTFVSTDYMRDHLKKFCKLKNISQPSPSSLTLTKDASDNQSDTRKDNCEFQIDIEYKSNT